MPVTPQDRPIDTLREETVDQLIMNYGHGKLSREAFERRLDEALDTKSHDRAARAHAGLGPEGRPPIPAQKKAELGIRVDTSAASRVDETDMINASGQYAQRRMGRARVIRIINVFGGTELDFTDARFTAEPLTSRCSAYSAA